MFSPPHPNMENNEGVGQANPLEARSSHWATLPPQTALLCWFDSAQLPLALMLLHSAGLSPTQLPLAPVLLQLGSSGAWALQLGLALCCCLSLLPFVPLGWHLRLIVAVLQHRVLKLRPEGMGKGLTVVKGAGSTWLIPIPSPWRDPARWQSLVSSAQLLLPEPHPQR